MLDTPHYGILSDHQQKDCSQIERERLIMLSCKLAHFLESLIIRRNEETGCVNYCCLLKKRLYKHSKSAFFVVTYYVIIEVGSRILLGCTDIGTEGTLLAVYDYSAASRCCSFRDCEDAVHLNIL